ncbi:MAG: FG-GAP-like repeat-containing protein, partial [Nannocystaceae bacterium]
DTLGHAIDGAQAWDAIEEHQALAQIERSLFARAREPVSLSRYLLLRPLGSGGTGVVYDGYDPELARRVAVKVLRSGRRTQESVKRARARFLREAQSIARLSHPNVIAVYDVGTYTAEQLAPGTRAGLQRGSVEDEGVFIVMELVEGHDVGQWLDRGRRSWREVVDVFIDAGQGLAAAHRAGIVHRDFKPGNVLVGDDGRVKVVDFGLALTYGGTESRSVSANPSTVVPPVASLVPGGEHVGPALDKLTRTGTLLGTPAYMAPEQHGGDPADQEADQFAFCASLFRALYGRYAFEGQQLDVLYSNKLAGRIQAPPESSRVPAWVHRVVRRGLQPDPAERFTSMEELLRALQADPQRRRRRWAARAVVPLGLAGVAYAGWVATRPGHVSIDVSSRGQPVAGARVTVDGQELPGGEGDVAAGLHRVQVTAPRHEPAQTVVEVSRGGLHELAIELDHEQGTFELELEPAGGHVFIDGVDYGSRLRALSIDTGPHELLLRHEGYVDERLQWTARAGRATEGFVALRKALTWARPASGSYRAVHWLGDVDGDGLDDLVQRRFTMLTAYDPWNDEELWRIELGASPFFRLCDVDGDGVRDVVTVRYPRGSAQLVVWTGAGSGRRPQPRWTRLEPRAETTELHAEVACVGAADGGGADGGGEDLVIAGLQPQRVLRLRGRDGALQWSSSVADVVLHAVPLHGGSDSTTAVDVAIAVVTASSVEGLALSDGAPRWSADVTVAPRQPDGRYEPSWATAWQRSVDEGRGLAVAAALDSQPGDDLLLYAGSSATGLDLVAIGGAAGQVQWRTAAHGLQDLRSGAALGDADGDGFIDVLVQEAGEAGRVSVVSGRSGRTVWTSDAAYNRAQLLDDLPAPLVAAAAGPELTLLDAATGQIVASTRVEGGPSSPVATADWDGDGQLDLLVGGRGTGLRVFDLRLATQSTVPLEVPVETIEASRDADKDGFVDLLLQARGPAVMVGPKVRWERRPLDAIRATPVIDDLDGDGELEVALFGTLDEGNRLQLLDARTGGLEASSDPSHTQIVIRPPVVLRTGRGADLLAVGGGLTRFSGRDAILVDRYPLATAYASPTVADLDGDGREEIIVATWEGPGEIHALDAQTLVLRWKTELGPLGSFGAPHVSDVDGDGRLEVVVAALDGRVVCLSAGGALKWATDTGGRLNFEPTVADLDGDGAQEVLVAPHLDDDPLVVLRGIDGAERARWSGMASRRARPLARDVDGDGRPEVLAATGARGLVGLHGDGTVRWSYRFVDGDGLQPGASGSPILADLEGDGRDELIAGFDDGSVHVVDARDGTLVWRFSTGREEVEASPAVADVDGDGDLEVLVAGHDRQLLCLDHRPGAR